MKGIYTPNLVKIEKIIQETPDIKTIRLAIEDKNFTFLPGQFIELSVPNIGEAPFCISSSPTWRNYIECSIKKMGKVTQAIHELEEGDMVGIRGPYGNGFPIDMMKGKNLIFVGGGIGIAPLRSLIWYCIDNRDYFKEMTIIYGARSVADLVYKEELEKFKTMPHIKTILTVDPGGETKEWEGKIGFVPTILEEVHPSSKDAFLITCGPPIMIRIVLRLIDKLGFHPEQVITTLERKMQCGVGKCGHCMIGNIYVCKDGPVFTYKEIKEFQEEI
jgi:sulfite reductase subunit B